MSQNSNSDVLDDDAKEFLLECQELLDTAETDLLSLDQKGNFDQVYASVFRVFHSLKGGAGMFGLKDLNHHMHLLENQLTQCGQKKIMSSYEISFFLKGIDVAKKLIQGEKVHFNYEEFNQKEILQSPVSLQKPKNEKTIVEETTAVVKELKNYVGSAIIIDDENEILDILKDTLEGAHFKVSTFTNPFEAINSFKSVNPDIVLTDMKMPEMSGLDVLKNVKKIDHEIPVIFVSGFLDTKTLIDSINCGVHGAIEKPFKESNIITLSTSALKISKMHKLLARSVHLMLYQFADLEDLMKSKGQTHQIALLKNELKRLLDFQKSIKEEKKAS